MSTKDDLPQAEVLFQKFQQYFDQKFEKICNETRANDEASALKELKNKIDAQELSKPGNIAQFSFCGQNRNRVRQDQDCLDTENRHRKGIRGNSSRRAACGRSKTTD